MPTAKRIQRIIRNVPQHWVGDGFPVRSLFSYHDGDAFDPFLLLDYAGPFQFAPHEAKRGVGEHPHRGFETVTIVYQGEVEHRDSSGSHGIIGPGEVQWMTAASGVVHEEFHSEKFTRQGGTLEMVQLWVNLPSQFKRTKPKYQGIPSSKIPVVPLHGDSGFARVIAGQLLNVQGPAQTFTPINVWDIHLEENKSLELSLPAKHTSIIIVQHGSIRLDSENAKDGELVLFDRNGGSLIIESITPSRLLVLTGEPINEPIVGKGPFVMNTRDEISQAILDYQTGKMGHL